MNRRPLAALGVALAGHAFELRQVWYHHRRGEMGTRELHDKLVRSHHGQLDRRLRQRGPISYDDIQEGKAQA